MASSADTLSRPGSSLDCLAAFLKAELAPYPGRAATVARTVTACVITMLLVMMFKLPNGFLAVFYALAISRADAHSTVRNAFHTLLANIAALMVSVAGIALFIDYPLPRFLYIVSIFFLAFFVTRTLSSSATAFGFTIIAVAAASVPIIWARPNSFRPDLETVVWTAFGIMLGTLATVLTEWLFASGGTAATGPPYSQPIFFPDAFSNPAYVKFALKGCLAASICYVFWAAVDWPGLGVCTVTCVIAAPVANLGSSRQRLTTRLAGLFTGGVICGIGSQIFLLPAVDSIVGFTILFAAFSAIAAWFATSSPRLNYFGRQMALAYYLTIFQGFGINSSLTASRDRLTGILLGLLVMWLVFDVCSADEH
jgi:uncharacterized membrane protein YccC